MLYPDLHYGLTFVRCIYDKRAHFYSVPCCLYVKSSCCIFLVKVNAKTCPNFLLIFSQKVVIRFCLFLFFVCASLLYSLRAIAQIYTRHRNACFAQVSTYRHAVRAGIYVTFACRGFSFKVHPLSIHLSAYELLRPPLHTKDRNRLQLVT